MDVLHCDMLLQYHCTTQVVSNGLSMSFLGCFHGVVSTRHLPTQREFSTDSYHVKKKYKARLLWVDVLGKAVGLSLQKQLVGGNSFDFSDIEIGDKFEGLCVPWFTLEFVFIKNSND